jgi:hypothetical protein
VLSQVFQEVLSSGLDVGRILPRHLAEAGQGAPEVWEVEIPCCVVMGKMPQRLPVRQDLDRRKGGVGELPDVLPAPFRGLNGRSDRHEQAERDRHKIPFQHGLAPLPSCRTGRHRARADARAMRRGLIDASRFLW